MKISVIICTYNRCESLKDTLESLLKQELGKGFDFDYEVVVVDNNSKDKTKEMVDSYIPIFNSHLRYVFDSEQGLSHARNKGIMEAKGEIVSFIDDDVIVDKKWLLNIALCFKEYNCDGVGGRINPLWLSKIPDWFSDRLNGKLGILDYGDKPFEIKSQEKEFYGGNFSCKKQLLIQNGLFDENLGRKGARLYAGEDSAMFNKLFNSGAKLMYQPKAVILHKILPSRLRKAYFIKMHFFSGYSYARSLKSSGINILGIPLWFVKNSIITFSKFLFSFFTMGQKERFRCELKCITNLGVYFGCIRKLIKNG